MTYPLSLKEELSYCFILDISQTHDVVWVLQRHFLSNLGIVNWN